MAWQDKIGGCFGEVDKKFGRHPLDYQRAAELLPILLKENVTYPEFANAVENYLRSNKCGGKHIEHELSLIETLYKPWIDEDWD